MITSLLLAATCGGVCAQSYVVRQKVVVPYVAPVYAPQISYFVGAPIRAQSIVEHQKRTDPDYQSFLEFKAWKAGAQRAQMQSAVPQQAQAQQPSEPPAVTGPLTVANTCARCHGTTTPKGGFFMDGQPNMLAQDGLAAIEQVALGKMPPDKQLTREERNQILMDLLRLWVRPEQPQQPEPLAAPEDLPPLPQPPTGQ